MKLEQLLNIIVHFSDSEHSTALTLLKPESKSLRLFTYLSRCATNVEVCTNEGAILHVYRIGVRDKAYRKVYLSMMRLIDQLARRLSRIRTHYIAPDGNSPIGIRMHECDYILGRSLAEKGKWKEALSALRRAESSYERSLEADEFSKAQLTWLKFVASTIVDNDAYSHNVASQVAVRDVSARALLHSIFMDLVAVELKHVQRHDSIEYVHDVCGRLDTLRLLPMLSNYGSTIDYFISVLMSGYYTKHRQSEAAVYQHEMLLKNQEMLGLNFSFIAVNMGSDQSTSTHSDTHYASALRCLSARDYRGAASAFEFFIDDIQSQPDLYARYINILMDCYLSANNTALAHQKATQFHDAMTRYGTEAHVVYSHVLITRVLLYTGEPIPTDAFKNIVRAELNTYGGFDVSDLLLRLKAKIFFIQRDKEGLELIWKECTKRKVRSSITPHTYEFTKLLIRILRLYCREVPATKLNSYVSNELVHFRELSGQSMYYHTVWLETASRSL